MEKPQIGHVLQLTLRRNRHGVQLAYKVAPEVEELFSAWSQMNQVSASNYARHWAGKDAKDHANLLVWYPGGPDGVITSRGRQFVLDKPGNALFVPVDLAPGTVLAKGQTPPQAVNLTFMRVVGASKDEQVINLRGVYQEEYTTRLAEAIKAGVAAFYADFMKPIGVEILVSTQRF